jgi:predicted  nucleic acid-binding Zn-ribbon protein
VTITRNSVNEVVEELPALRETARGVAALANELSNIKSTTLSIRTELSAVLEKVTKLTEYLSQTDEREAVAAEINITEKLTSLREAIENLSVSGMT